MDFGKAKRFYEGFVQMVLFQGGVISKDDDMYLSG
jgi:hypothetical protein